MEFSAHFKYEREITVWLSGFIGRALPGACFPYEVNFDIFQVKPSSTSTSYHLYMTLDVGNGQIDIEATMVVRGSTALACAPFLFEGIKATRDVQDVEGTHLKTLIWDDAEARWLELSSPIPAFSIIDGGLHP